MQLINQQQQSVEILRREKFPVDRVMRHWLLQNQQFYVSQAQCLRLTSRSLLVISELMLLRVKAG
ncbi:MAG TPA: hypothetical protein V6C71_06530 [Coleofasciculaceae cyanobacterium]